MNAIKIHSFILDEQFAKLKSNNESMINPMLDPVIKSNDSFSVKFLLENGADKNVKDNVEKTPLDNSEKSGS